MASPDVPVATPRPPETVEITVQEGDVVEVLAVDAIGVDQDTRSTKCELGVMTEIQLTHDSLHR